MKRIALVLVAGTWFSGGASRVAAQTANDVLSYSGPIHRISHRHVPVDIDGDMASEIGVFRRGYWIFYEVDGSNHPWAWTGSWPPGCVPVPMDYDGDGRADLSQFCPDGLWHFYHDDGSYDRNIWTGGVAGDQPAPADYDGDGTDDVVVFRNGAWLFFDFDTGEWNASRSVWTGAPTSAGTPRPVPMDYDGDGRAEFTVYAGGPWHFFHDDGSYNRGIWTGGVAGDIAAPADYDGNDTEDVVVFRQGAWMFYDFATGAWNASRSVWTGAPPHMHGGQPLPAPLDYDGDGAVDFTVYSGGPWHLYNHDGSYERGIWVGGIDVDQPLSRRLLP